MKGFYILIGEKTKAVTLDEWVKWQEGNTSGELSTLAQMTIGEGKSAVMISTVFLGIGTYPGHEGRVFETMVFNLHGQDYQDRYVSYKEAMAGHLEWVNKVMAEI